jgi:hypothetical protein
MYPFIVLYAIRRLPTDIRRLHADRRRDNILRGGMGRENSNTKSGKITEMEATSAIEEGHLDEIRKGRWTLRPQSPTTRKGIAISPSIIENHTLMM